MLNKALVLSARSLPVKKVGQSLYEKEIIRVGSFSHDDPDTGETMYEFDVDSSDLDNWEAQGTKMLENGLDIPMPVGHTEEPTERAATAKKFVRKKNSDNIDALFVQLEFKTPKYAEELKDSQVSIYSPPNYFHNGVHYPRPIKHIAFTDYPVVPGLDPLAIVASASKVKTPKKGFEMKVVDFNEAYGLEVAEDAAIDVVLDTVSAHIDELNTKIEELEAKVKELEGETEDTEETDEEEPTISASTKNTLLKLSRKNRDLELRQLFSDGKISAAQLKSLQSKWAGDTLSLSVSQDAAFESLVSSLSSNPRIVSSGERTGRQVKSGANSRLVSSAQKRAESRK
jgi:phage I-like protein